MTVKVSIELDKEFTVAADAATVFELLADVPKSASHFPKVDKLIDLGGNSYRWEMEKIGIGDHAIQTIYACNYKPDAKSGVITWEPIKEVGNSVVSGCWTISEADNGTLIRFQSQAELTLPLPGLLKLAISPVVKYEFSGMVDTYLSNLTKTFSV